MKYLLPIALAAFFGPAPAEVPPEQKPEVEHLLSFVGSSGCVIERNGNTYAANRAVSHIRKKYAYFEGDIETTEEFIELSASKSTLSGKYYMVSCDGGRKIRARDWLLQELRNFRDNRDT